MPHQIFVSYSTTDQLVAEHIVAALEHSGMPCWIADREIQGGGFFASEIEEAIRIAKAVVLVVSPEFNKSIHTRKEIILALNEGKPILPIRIIEFQPWSHLRYFLCDCQWVDVPEAQIERSIDLIRRVLSTLINDEETGRSPGREKWKNAALPDGVVSSQAIGLVPPAAFLALKVPRGRNLLRPQPSQLLQAHNAFLPLIGRDQEIADLTDFISSSGFFRWQVWYGAAGMGKTRLAVEFCNRAILEGWHSGLVDSTSLNSFVRADGFTQWRPEAPTLIVVDYAASKVDDLCRLIEHLAYLEGDSKGDTTDGPDKIRVRLLLIERHVNEDRGWLRKLLSTGEGEVSDYLRHDCYTGLRELTPPSLGEASGAEGVTVSRQLIEATFAAWQRLSGSDSPKLHEFTAKEWRKLQFHTGNRPLYLQMAALHACEQGTADHLASWGRGELLNAAVERERNYINRECDNDSLRRALEHMTAILCLTGIGVARGRKWIRVVDEELRAMGATSVTPDQVEQARFTIFQDSSSANQDSETGLIQPDIVSEAYAANVLRDEEDPPTETLQQLIKLGGIKTWANMLRMVQDLGGLEGFKGIEEWLPPLVEDRPLDELRQLLNVIPDRSLGLHKFALHVGEQILHSLPSENILDRAQCLLATGTHRHRMAKVGRSSLEQAERELKEAITLFGRYIAQNSLNPELRGCLSRSHRILCTIVGYLGDTKAAAIEAWKGTLVASGAPVPLHQIDDVPTMKELDRLEVPDDNSQRLETANCLNNLAIDFLGMGQAEAAVRTAQRAIQIGEDLVAVNWYRYAPDLARYLNNYGQACMVKKDTKNARIACMRSAEIREEFARDNPDEFAHPLSLTLGNLLVTEYQYDNYESAKKIIIRIIALYKELERRDPVAYRSELAQQHHNIGYLCNSSGHFEEGLIHTLDGLAIRKELLEEDFDAHALALGWSYHNAGAFCVDLARYEEAKDHYTKSYEIRTKWADAHPDSRVPELIQVISSLAKVHHRLGNTELELELSEKALQLVDFHTPENSNSGMAWYNLADSLREVGRIQEAYDAAQKAAVAFRAKLEDPDEVQSHKNLSDNLLNLAAALTVAGDCGSNTEMLEEAIAISAGILDRMRDRDSEFELFFGASYCNMGQAKFRLGQIKGIEAQVVAGIESLKSAISYFHRHDQGELAQESKTQLPRAEAALSLLKAK